MTHFGSAKPLKKIDVSFSGSTAHLNKSTRPVLTDEEVIHQFLETRPNDCFETLYNRYVNRVYNRCFSLTKDLVQAQDFTQDIFVRMFCRLGSFQGRATFSTWLYSISYNYCMDQLRLSNRTVTTNLTDMAELQGPSIEETEQVELTEFQLHHLSRAMNAISPQAALLLRLKYQDGLDVKEIAKQLNLKESAVKMRLKRSRDKVRQLCTASMQP